MIRLTRRDIIAATGTMIAVGFAGPAIAQDGNEAEFQRLVTEFARGAQPQAGRIALSIEQRVENGNSVPVGISVDSAMTDSDRLEAVMLLAPSNPIVHIATFTFGPLSGRPVIATRMRLARSQAVTAIARFADGAVHMAATDVEVAVGGCVG